jgi:hypothetical protein
MLRIGKAKEIRSVDDWLAVAPPMRDMRQWVDGRSATELPKAWFPVPGDPRVPPELQALLDSREETQAVVFDRGEPERTTVFDDCGGEGRDAALVLWGRGPRGKILMSIEAKADEPFGETAGDYVERSAARDPRSRVPERFGLLCRGVLGVASDEGEARAVGYQLFTAIAGTLVEAQMYAADSALFVVHEFVGRTDDRKVAANAADLNRFVRLLSKGRTKGVPPGTLAGPFSVPGNKHFAGTKHLFVGKCQRVA